MKKYNITVKGKDGKYKLVDIWIDDDTAIALEQCRDEHIKQIYLEEEYKDSLINRKETRRHQSFELSQESGFEFIDSSEDTESEVLCEIEYAALHKALKHLKPQQQMLIKQIYFEEITLSELARQLGVDKTSIRDRLNTIYKKIKKFL